MRRSLRLPLLLAALAVAAMTSQPANSAPTCPPEVIEYQYFYDAAHTQPAGNCTTLCSGNTYCNGERTAYYISVVHGPCYCW